MAARIKDMLDRRRDEWLAACTTRRTTSSATSRRAAPRLACWNRPAISDWEMFTCLNSLRDVEGTVDLVLDQRSTGLRVD